LRTEEKKREALRLKDLKNASPVTPATPTTPVEIPAASALPPAPTTDHEDLHNRQEAAVSGAPVDTSHGELASASQAPQEQLPVEIQQDIPQPSIEVRSHTHLHFESC
jgi:hypothetical protein